MKLIESQSGRTVLEVVYDSTECDWTERIQQALECYGLQCGRVTIIARPRTPQEVEDLGTIESMLAEL